MKNDRATWHAQRVVNGEIEAGLLHRLACERHLRDLKRQNTEDFPFHWDVEASNRIIDFAETLTIAEGEEPKEVTLYEHQAFDLGSLMGWKNQEGYRRFRRSYISMARQNGKTFFNGILGTYIALLGGYNHGKLFTVATKKRQARLAWEEMAKFINVDEELGELFTVRDWKSLIECNYTDCTIEALSKDAGLDDGFRAIYASIDEIHQHRDNSIYKAIYNGTRSLKETLISMISTRGGNLNSFAKEMDDYAVNILKGGAFAEDFFVDIYALDKDDDAWDERNWVKANPILATSDHGVDVLRSDAQTAKDMGGSDMRDFLIKALNLWVENADDNYIDVEKWAENGSNRTLEDFRGRSCWVGLDLSSGGDLTTLALEFEDHKDDGTEHFFIHSHSFMPRGRHQEHIDSDLAPYDLWEQMGLLTVTGGSTDFKNDYKFIIKYLKDIQEEYDLIFNGIGIDPHNADGILGDLEEFGVPIMIVTQSARFMNDATVDVQLLVKGNQVEYNKNNELLTWSFTNAKTVMNSFGEIKVDKKNNRFQRIDPVDAVLDAHTMMLKTRDKEVINVESELESYLDKMGWT
ncbi:terminase large subunit [Thiopseudomonas sp. 4R-3cl]|nr:terminase large subunit [Thiopseudomonas sp. 4R-3cl]